MSDASFPGQPASGLAPSPSRENPGQVFPHSDPTVPDPMPAAPSQSVPGTGPPAQAILANPYVLRESLVNLDHALTHVISQIQKEENSVGAASNEHALLRKFIKWRDELCDIRTAQHTVGGPGRNADAATEGGLFED